MLDRFRSLLADIIRPNCPISSVHLGDELLVSERDAKAARRLLAVVHAIESMETRLDSLDRGVKTNHDRLSALEICHQVSCPDHGGPVQRPHARRGHSRRRSIWDLAGSDTPERLQ